MNEKLKQAHREYRLKHAEKYREISNRFYQKNKDKIKKKITAYKQETKQWFKDYKKTLKCVKCGENHPATLDFHHIQPNEKETHIAEAMQRCWGKERILAEIAKCVVLCANCHRKEHYKE